jgi:hypothetical protein
VGKPQPGHRIGNTKLVLWILCFLPDWVRGRLVHQPSELDAAVKTATLKPVAQAFRPEAFPHHSTIAPTL